VTAPPSTSHPSSTTLPPATKGPPPSTAVPTPTTGGAPPAAPLAVTARTVYPGDPVTVSGSGFQPGARITITLRSTAIVVGYAVADAQGRFSVKVVVPHDAPLGDHHLEAAGPAATGSGQTTLMAKVSIATPPGGKIPWLLIASMAALTLVLAAGAGVVLTSSARWRSRAT
jgi:hypothetical protein